jgi:acetylornithine deacetylase/succinyl-diaminopimelate desuccinylase-like protein
MFRLLSENASSRATGRTRVLRLPGLAPLQAPQSARREDEGEHCSYAERVKRPDEPEGNSRLYGPVVADNGAGIAAMPAVAGEIRAARIPYALPLVFIGDVGEEGEGGLRRMRHVFAAPRRRDSIAYSVMVDGAGSDTVVAESAGEPAV